MNTGYVSNTFFINKTDPRVYIADVFSKNWVTINGAHVFINDSGQAEGAGHAEGNHPGGHDADNKVADLHERATAQRASFDKSADKIGEKLDSKVEHDPNGVKSITRMTEKLNEYKNSKDPVSEIKDTNRVTLLVKDSSQLRNVVSATEKEFGKDVTVKDKFGKEGYRSAIINVVGSKGVMGEVAVTTPEMWNARMKLGGDVMYHAVRSGNDSTGSIELAMGNLYANAQMAVNERLAK